MEAKRTIITRQMVWEDRRKEWIDYALKTKNKKLFEEMQSNNWYQILRKKYNKVGRMFDQIERELETNEK